MSLRSVFFVPPCSSLRDGLDAASSPISQSEFSLSWNKLMLQVLSDSMKPVVTT